jgi:cytochrome P450
MATAELADPAVIDRFVYLEGCLDEAMRPWPTTPLLARETIQDVTLAGQHVDEGTQIVMLNVFNHRDPDHVEDADGFSPERWAGGRRDYRFNHLSNGSQDCPGGALVQLPGKAVTAQVLDRWWLSLEQPSIASGQPLPHMLDFFNERFSARPR